MIQNKPSVFSLIVLLLLVTGPTVLLVYGSPTETESSDETKTEPEPEAKPDDTAAEDKPDDTTDTPQVEKEQSPQDLPKCDGSFQDCTTPNGDICKAGQGGHECECADDMSDCPNHPSVLEKPATAIQQTNEDDINPCLLDPSDPICPKPDPETQECPAGWAQNEDGNCFPLHPEGCPSGYHGHEDDETGRCIPNSTPCDPGYEFNDDHTNCEREHFVCHGIPSVVPCPDEDDNNDHNNGHNKDLIIKHIHDTKIVKQIIDADDNLDVDQTIIAISYDEGKGINCVIENDNDGQCETFDVPVDKGKADLLVIVPFN